jgi:3',5'-cyclic-AMP phosphodiesterase
MLIAQISDPHVGTPDGRIERLCRTSDHLEHAVAHLNALRPRPDVALLTGDVVDEGGVEEYERARTILEPLAMPLYLIPGNHDDRASLTRVFAQHRYLPRDGGFIQYTIEDWPVRLVALDTLVPGSAAGRLCEQRLDWLDEQLSAAPVRPTLIFMHHPPFVTGLTVMDREMGLDGIDAFAAVVRRHPQVERIVCGHVHRPILRRFAGTVACTCPSTAHQLGLDLPPETRLTVVMEPPACMLHCWLGEAGGLASHLSVIGGHYPSRTVFDGTRWLPLVE